MATDPYEFDGTDWQGSGYFGCPVPPEEAELSTDIMAAPWFTWAVILQQAKRGNFHDVPILLDLYKYPDPVLRSICYELFGDAAPSADFRRVEEQVLEGKNVDRIIFACESLAQRGRLQDVQLLLAFYMRNYEHKDCDSIPVLIRKMIGEVTNSPREVTTPEGYRREVTSRWQSLVDRFGSDQVLVFRGEILDARYVADYVLAALGRPHFSFQLRRRFEAITGIDCSPFYSEDGELRPLAAAAIVEDFLDSGKAENFERGVRYFFGHRID